jgi:hypothetical protein
MSPAVHDIPESDVDSARSLEVELSTSRSYRVGFFSLLNYQIALICQHENG